MTTRTVERFALDENRAVKMLRDFEQTAPALAPRGHPRLTKAGNEKCFLIRHDLRSESPLLTKEGNGLLTNYATVLQETARRAG
jgi:hypothetical protein